LLSFCFLDSGANRLIATDKHPMAIRQAMLIFTGAKQAATTRHSVRVIDVIVALNKNSPISFFTMDKIRMGK